MFIVMLKSLGLLSSQPCYRLRQTYMRQVYKLWFVPFAYWNASRNYLRERGRPYWILWKIVFVKTYQSEWNLELNSWFVEMIQSYLDRKLIEKANFECSLEKLSSENVGDQRKLQPISNSTEIFLRVPRRLWERITSVQYYAVDTWSDKLKYM